jgi:hypothetical protein
MVQDSFERRIREQIADLEDTKAKITDEGIKAIMTQTQNKLAALLSEHMEDRRRGRPRLKNVLYGLWWVAFGRRLYLRRYRREFHVF